MKDSDRGLREALTLENGGAVDLAGESLAPRLEAIRSDSRIRSALADCRQSAARIMEEQVRITEVPAPPFGESARAEYFRSALAREGFAPAIDGIGNVLAPFGRTGPDPVVIGAHLDTVFPESTPLAPVRNGSRVELPGIADNGAGLVALLWTFAAARRAGVGFRRPVILVANVGEEGAGDLRGVRHLFQAPPWEGTCDFIALDVAGVERITHRGLGSRRFRVTMTGPGGHSWADFGRPNPVEGLARAVLGLGPALEEGGEAAYNVGRIEGGISVNAIPSSAFMEVDLRATGETRLDAMESRFRQLVLGSATRHRLAATIDSIGRRPSGETAPESLLVRAAIEATRASGSKPLLGLGSTDANVPMSLGIPAISIGAGGSAGGVHTPAEWYDPTHRQAGIERLLLTVALTAGLD